MQPNLRLLDAELLERILAEAFALIFQRGVTVQGPGGTGSATFAGDTANWTEAFNNKNAGAGKTLTVTPASVNDGNGGNNYSVSYATSTAGTITPRA
ncbi:MAG: YDG domain-containing protein, partial [Methanoregula sp.]